MGTVRSGLLRVGPLGLALLGCCAIAAPTPPALADTFVSPNWAGYVVHRNHVSFTSVSGVWVQPSASCVPGELTRTWVWVGLGGFTGRSNALEQIGTAVDCSPSGTGYSVAWWELVPALSRGIQHQVLPGDLIAASVTVRGRRVRMTLTDFTRRWTFVKHARARRVDTSSADWVVESPSNCFFGPSCHLFALADFGTATFVSALARSSSGYAGPIAAGRWRATRVVLKRHRPDRGRFSGNAVSAKSAATPGPLLANGTAFTVTYGLR